MRAVKSTLASLAALALVMPAIANDKQPVALPPNTFIDAQPEAHYLAKDVLIGAIVQNTEGKVIGEIEDIILNDWNRVHGVVIGTGGFLGIAGKRIGIRLSALEFRETDGKRVIVLPNVSKDMLTAVAPFVRAEPKKSLLERAMQKARELTDRSTETAKEAYEKAKEEAGPTYEKAKETAIEAYDRAKEAAAEVYEQAKEAASATDQPAAQGAAGQYSGQNPAEPGAAPTKAPQKATE
jgi:hypothetical protein